MPEPRFRPIETLRSVLRFEPLELDPVTRRLRRAANVADLRAMARRRSPTSSMMRVYSAAYFRPTAERKKRVISSISAAVKRRA